MANNVDRIELLTSEINRLRREDDASVPVEPFKYPPSSVQGRIERRWNLPKSEGGMNVERGEVRQYPKMLFKARQPERGGPPLVVDPSDERWTERNQIIANDEDQHRKMKSDGWADDPDEAVRLFHRAGDAQARQAAERAYSDRNMSDAAKAEIDAAEAATSDHVLEVKRGPGRPRKVG